MDTKGRVLRAAVLAIVVLLWAVSLCPTEPVLTAGGGSKEICSFLGDDPKPSILDQDIFEFSGTKGEIVTVTLQVDSSGSHTGRRANLSLWDEISRAWFFKTTTGSLPRTINTTLPATGKYLILVAELPGFAHMESFRGEYCLTFTSLAGAYATLVPTPWLEPPENSIPVANAGPDQTVFVNQTVTLDGSGSNDIDGDSLTYKWSLISAPPGSAATLTDPSAMITTFFVDQPGTYVAQLVVNDGKTDSVPETANVTVNILMTSVPDVVGMTRDDAQSAIVGARLSVGPVTSGYHRTIPAGSVMSQDPASGSEVASGTSVHLVISLGSSWRQVGPQGGIFEFPNGIILDIPPGAVPEDTEIEVTAIQCEQVDEILSVHAFPTHAIRCLGGFTGKPDGQVFILPIKATVPVLPLRPGENPIQFKVYLDEYKYRLSHTKITYLGQAGVVEMEIQDFSGHASGGLSTDEMSDWTVPPDSCCFEYPTPKDCCCYKDIYSESEWSLLEGVKGTTECVISSLRYLTILTKCDGQPQQSSWVQESSPDCPKDLNCEIRIDPPVSNVFVCQENSLKASVACQYEDGEPGLFSNVKLFPFWQIDNKIAATIDPVTGKVQGLKEGLAQIEAGMAIPDPRITPGKAVLNVRSNIRSFSVTPLQETIKFGEGVTLQAEIVGADGNPLDPSTVSWESSNPGIADVNQGTGASIVVGGEDCGTVIITAKYQYECEMVQTTATVTVEPRVNSCRVTPPSITLSIGEFETLNVTPLDAQGNGLPLDPLSFVAWGSSNMDAAWLSPSSDSSTVVEAKNFGDSMITAWYSLSSKCEPRSCQAQVTVNCEKCNFQVTPPVQELVLGSSGTTLTAQLRDVKGLIINPPTAIVQWESNSGVVSLSHAAGWQTNVTPIREGVGTITAKYTDGYNQEKTATAIITVIAPPKTWHTWEGSFINTPSGIKKLAADGQGNVFAAYIEGSGSDFALFVGRVDSGEIKDKALFPDSAGLVDFYVDSLGNRILLYWDGLALPNYRLLARRYNIGRGWDVAPTVLASGAPNGVYFNTTIAGDSFGNAIIAWSSMDTGTPFSVGTVRYDANDGWESPIFFPEDPAPTDSTIVKIATNTSGNAILVWTGHTLNGDRAIRARKYDPIGGWEDNRTLIASPLHLDDRALSIVMDSQGNAIVTSFTSGAGTRATHYNVDRGWQTSFIVAEGSVVSGMYNSEGWHMISMDEDGNAMLVYQQATGNPRASALMSKGYSVDRGWDETGTIIEPVFTPNIEYGVIEWDGQGILAFTLRGGGNATLITGEWSSSETLTLCYDPDASDYHLTTCMQCRYPENLQSYRLPRAMYIHTRLYQSGKGWENTKSTIAFGKPYWGGPESDIYISNPLIFPSGRVFDRYGNATFMDWWEKSPSRCFSKDLLFEPITYIMRYE